MVVVSWNTAALLRRCLESLSAAAEAARIDLVVVDNDSSDGSPEMVEREFAPGARLVRAGANIGFGRAANLGARSARTRWIAIANADIEVPPEVIDGLVSLGERHPDAGLIAPCLVRPSGECQESVYRYPSVKITTLAALGAHRLRSGLRDRMFRGRGSAPSEPTQVDWVMGAFVLVRRAAFEQVGGFAEDQWMYAEDLDLCWRLRRHGWASIYAPALSVIHVGGAAAEETFGASSGTLPVLRAYYHWLRTRRGAVSMWTVASVTLAGLAIRVAAYRLLMLFGRATGSYLQARDWLRLNLTAVMTARNARV